MLMSRSALGWQFEVLRKDDTGDRANLARNTEKKAFALTIVVFLPPTFGG